MKVSFVVIALLIIFVKAAVFDKHYEEAYNIAESMTLEQKIGQTIQVDFYAMHGKNGTSQDDAIKLALGSLLIGGNGCPDENGNLINFDNMKEEQEKQVYASATVEKWKKFSDKFNYTVDIRANGGKTYKIKPFLATDAVHGDQHVAGSILFPQNIGMSCTHNPDNFYNAGFWTTKSLKRYGFNYAFTPTVAVSHNPQWGRFYETMGQNHDNIYKYAKAFTEGVQGKDGTFTGVMGSVKHFFADGATFYGADEGNAVVGSFKSFVHHNIQGFNGSISSGIGSVMASYSAINHVPLSTGPYLKSILRGDLAYDGLVISDYSEIEKLSAQYLPTSLTVMQKKDAVAKMFAAGIDMFMIPTKDSMMDYIASVKIGLEENTIPMERLNDAVARIVAVKLGLGMIETTGSIKREKQEHKQPLHATTEYEDSLNAVHESLVMLKNKEEVIPVKASSLEYVVLVGEKVLNINRLGEHELFPSYDNIGMQSGGWTGRWHGFMGNPLWKGENLKSTNASSILDGLKNLNQDFNLVYPNYTSHKDTSKIALERELYLESLRALRKNMNANNTLIISVVGETPYAEMVGDVNIPYCQDEAAFGGDGCLYWPSTYSPAKQTNTLEVNFNEFEKKVISQVRAHDKNIPMVTVLLSGRPMIVNNILNESSAFISAFLPGTSGGQGIVDSIFGDYKFKANENNKANTLSFDWPQSMESLKNFPYYGSDGEVPTIPNALFKAGFGLSSAK